MLKTLTATNIQGVLMAKKCCRSNSGSIIAEYMAAIVVLFLVLVFPLINLTVFTYRYNLVVAAVHNAAHLGATAPTFSTAGTGALAVAQNSVAAFLPTVQGVKLVSTQARIKIADTATQGVSNNGMNTKLSAPADPQLNIYSIEVLTTATISPLMPLSNGIPNAFVPNVPGVTSPVTQTISAQELVENVRGLNQ